MYNYIDKLKECCPEGNFNKMSDAVPNTDDIKYDEVTTLSNLCNRGKECCSGVRWKASTTRFESCYATIMAYAKVQMDKGKYKQKSFNQFKISERGKPRDIAALKIEDRAIQKVFNQDVLLKVVAPTLVENNTASIKGKGIDYTIKIFKDNLRQHYKEYSLEGGIYQFDFSKYFESIPHQIIKDNIIKPMKLDPRLENVLIDFVDNFINLKGAKLRKDEFGWRGVGLGSEVSQTIALDAATFIDKYILIQLGCDKSGRYMDDGYVISNDLELLHALKDFNHKMAASFGLKLNEKKDRITTFKSQKYFTFLKTNYKMLEDGKIISEPSKQNKTIVTKRFKKWRKKLNDGIMTIEDICSSYNGWRASIERCDNTYTFLYNRDLEFIREFRDELRHFHRPFKCYIKCIQMKDGTFEYITKEKDNTRKSKTNNNPYYRNMINNQKRKANQNKKTKETQNNGERRTGSTNK